MARLVGVIVWCYPRITRVTEHHVAVMPWCHPPWPPGVLGGGRPVRDRIGSENMVWCYPRDHEGVTPHHVARMPTGELAGATLGYYVAVDSVPPVRWPAGSVPECRW